MSVSQILSCTYMKVKSVKSPVFFPNPLQLIVVTSPSTELATQYQKIEKGEELEI